MAVNSKKRRALWIVAGAVAVLATLVLVPLGFERLFPAPPNLKALEGLRWLKPAGAETAYAGDDACRSCHLREFTSHLGTPHANTLHDVAKQPDRPEFHSSGTVVDEQNGITYEMQSSEGKGWLIAHQAGRTERATPRWAFGAGGKAISYLGDDKDGFLEFRTAYYARIHGWSFTAGRGPGDELPGLLGHTYDSLEAASCFGCHTTILIGSARGIQFDRSRLNVGCEACHGPCRTHVDGAASLIPSGGRGATVPFVLPPRLTPPADIEVCMKCHRKDIDLPPGAHPGPDDLFAYPGAALTSSRCFQASEGRLSCVTCHDPHAAATKEPEAYTRVCRSCHTPPKGTPCRLKKATGCVSCHMPGRQISAEFPLQFHNHWIH